MSILNTSVDDLLDLDFKALENNMQLEDSQYEKDIYLPEKTIQKLVIEYCRKKGIIAIGSTNGNNSNQKTVAFRKQQGQVKGMPDIDIKKWNGFTNQFQLELKAKNGYLKKDQKEMIEKLKAEHIPCSVSYGIYEAIYMIEKYLKGEPIIWDAKK